MSGRLAATALKRMRDRATVLTPNATTRRHDTMAKEDLRCYLSSVNLQPAATGGARSELASRRALYWEGGYALPLNAQGRVDARIRVNGAAETWAVVQGTVVPFPAGGDPPLYWRCDLVGGGS